MNGSPALASHSQNFLHCKIGMTDLNNTRVKFAQIF